MSDEFNFKIKEPEVEQEVEKPIVKPIVKPTVKSPKKKQSSKVVTYDDSAILERLYELEVKIVELDQLKKSVELAKTAWLGFRKSVKGVCDTAHRDRVTTLAVLDSFFEVDNNE